MNAIPVNSIPPMFPEDTEFFPPLKTLADLPVNCSGRAVALVLEDGCQYLTEGGSPCKWVCFAYPSLKDLDYYQVLAGRTAIYKYRDIARMVADRLTREGSAMPSEWPEDKKEYVRLSAYAGLSYPFAGLANEAGETLGKIKKLHRDDGLELTEERRSVLKKELGDTLWYLAESATVLGISLSEIALSNLEKLNNRKEAGTISGNGDNR